MFELATNDKYPVENENDKVRMEISTIGDHRLVSKADPKRRTAWANYRLYTYLDGYVGCTSYYTGNGRGAIMTPEDFIKATATQ